MNPITKAVASWKLLKAGLHLVKDPGKLDEVFDIADTLYESQKPMVEQMVQAVSQHEQGRRAFALRPRVGQIGVTEMRAMQPGSLGRAFGDFLAERNLDPYALPKREATDDPSYLNAHLYETHDLWHVVTGFETDVAGELGLQAFYAAQLTGKLPIVLLCIGLLNTFLYAHEDRVRRMDAITKGWAMGKRARPLPGYDWRASFERPLSEVQAELNLTREVRALAA